MLSYILLSVILVSLVSLISVFFIRFSNKSMHYMLSFAAGAMLGAVFFDLLPELLEKDNDIDLLGFVLIGWLAFFILEKFFHWYHCHHGKKEHAVGYLNLIGDAIHNFLDGAIIATSYLTDTHLGMVVTATILLHEIPQEIGDFSVLIYSGFSRNLALLANFFVSLTAIVGAILTYYFVGAYTSVSPILTALAAGGFLYIAASDITPELHKETHGRKSFAQTGFILIGMLIIFVFTRLMPH